MSVMMIFAVIASIAAGVGTYLYMPTAPVPWFLLVPGILAAALGRKPINVIVGSILLGGYAGATIVVLTMFNGRVDLGNPIATMSLLTTIFGYIALTMGITIIATGRNLVRWMLEEFAVDTNVDFEIPWPRKREDNVRYILGHPSRL